MYDGEGGGGGCENRFLRKIEWFYLVALNFYLANIPIIHRLLL